MSIKSSLSFYVLSAFMLLNALAMPLLVVDYEYRKEMIEELFCINKDKPELQCHGQCHLKGELEDTQEQQKKQEGKGGIVIAPNALAEELIQESPFLFSTLLTTEEEVPPYRLLWKDTHLYDIFHPPRFV
ncbi:hypothetical protein [Algivirga pacifica]|uniref:Uncharacterized protein n=1 Tax=Algivirga pacifica TaxID=1162670 RepID=A0ABP9DI29_9BACT